ncbi:MAG: hypothetical protein ACRC3H_24285 [Lachnospiraceae bacterium]
MGKRRTIETEGFVILNKAGSEDYDNYDNYDSYEDNELACSTCGGIYPQCKNNCKLLKE